jgi:hypothetical protein
MKQLSYLTFLVTIVLVMANYVQAQNQNGDLVIEVSTFARQENFISQKASLNLLIKEGDEEIVPETIDIKPIKQVIVAVDNSKSMKYILPNIIKQLKKVLSEKINLPTMITTFNEETEILSNFTTSVEQLKKSLDNIKISEKNTSLFKTIESLKNMAGDKITHLILITDGADTANQVINTKELLSSKSLTISYLNWGYGDSGATIDEPGYNSTNNGKSKIVKTNPSYSLSTIAKRSGGDVVNYRDWKTLEVYLSKAVNSGSYLYSLFWHTDNPIKSFYFTSKDKDKSLVFAKR